MCSPYCHFATVLHCWSGSLPMGIAPLPSLWTRRNSIFMLARSWVFFEQWPCQLCCIMPKNYVSVVFWWVLELNCTQFSFTSDLTDRVAEVNRKIISLSLSVTHTQPNKLHNIDTVCTEYTWKPVFPFMKSDHFHSADYQSTISAVKVDSGCDANPGSLKLTN